MQKSKRITKITEPGRRGGTAGEEERFRNGEGRVVKITDQNLQKNRLRKRGIRISIEIKKKLRKSN